MYNFDTVYQHVSGNWSRCDLDIDDDLDFVTLQQQLEMDDDEEEMCRDEKYNRLLHQVSAPNLCILERNSVWNRLQ